MSAVGHTMASIASNGRGHKDNGGGGGHGGGHAGHGHGNGNGNGNKRGGQNINHVRIRFELMDIVLQGKTQPRCATTNLVSIELRLTLWLFLYCVNVGVSRRAVFVYSLVCNAAPVIHLASSHPPTVCRNAQESSRRRRRCAFQQRA